MMKMMKGRGGDPVTLIIARCFLCMAKIPSRMHFVTMSYAVGHDDQDPVIENTQMLLASTMSQITQCCLLE